MAEGGTGKTLEPQGAGLPRSLGRLSRAQLEKTVARLMEENARLRQQVMADSSLWQIAHQDQLTELWNRRYADQRMAEELSRAKRESGYKFSVVLIDVDDLKRINDQMGHAGGDEALRWVARFLNHGLRGHDLCCRIGGDEFLLILPTSGEQDCRDLIERLRRRWRAAAEDDPVAVAVSIGAASFPTQGTTVEELLAVADDAMYTNKRRSDVARETAALGSVDAGLQGAHAAAAESGANAAPGAGEAAGDVSESGKESGKKNGPPGGPGDRLASC